MSPTILQHFKQILTQSDIILAEIGPKLSIFPKRYILGKLTITFVCLLCSILQQYFKKNLGKQIIRQGCIILAKGTFLEKLANIAVVFHIPLCSIISKKILREQIVRLCDFCPNCPLPQKGIFLENWLFLLISNYWTPLC